MRLRIELPLSDKAAKACVIAADRLGVEPWELAVHALAHREGWFDPKRDKAVTEHPDVVDVERGAYDERGTSGGGQR